MSDSAETIALGLLELLLENGKLASEIKDRPPTIAKKILFNAYADCLRAVHAGDERGVEPTTSKNEAGEGGQSGAWDPNAQGWSAAPEHKE